MRRPHPSARLLSAGFAGLVVLALTACGGAGEVAVDPGGQPAGDPMPTAIPAAPGEVYTSGLVTIMDKGDGPQVCLGAVAESYPPQCGGPRLIGWSWKDNPIHDDQGDVSWGEFALTGTWDGTAFTYGGGIPAALYDPMKPGPSPTPPTPQRSYDADGLEQVQLDLQRLPGYLYGSYDEARGQVAATVVYDDGTLQQWLDDTYGTDVVVLTSVLVDADDPDDAAA